MRSHGFSRPVPLLNGEGNRVIKCVFLGLEPGEGGPPKPHAHAHDRVVVVLHGTLVLEIGGHPLEVKGREAAFILAGTPHSIWNRGEEGAEALILDLKKGFSEGSSGSQAKKKRDIHEKKERILELVFSFCDRYLDSEYRELCGRLVEKMSRKKEVPFLSGKPEVWAAGVIHALGSINLLFTPWFEPHVAAYEIAAFFGISHSSMNTRSRQIREMFGENRLEREFSTSTMATMSRLASNILNPTTPPEVIPHILSLMESRRRGWQDALAKAGWQREYSNVYQFLVYLVDSEPLIWRRIQVPGDYSFWDLHVAVQDAMGWLDCHLHMFSMPRPGGNGVAHIGIPDEDELSLDPNEEPYTELAGWEEKIADWFTPDNALASYEYDFGDGWIHGIELEGILPRDPDVFYPRCLDGSGACPPEDCGGIPGYYRMLRILADPSHPKRQGYIEWLGSDFDPLDFRPEEVEFDDPALRFFIAFST